MSVYVRNVYMSVWEGELLTQGGLMDLMGYVLMTAEQCM